MIRNLQDISEAHAAGRMTFKVVSFDVFRTLLSRLVPSKCVEVMAAHALQDAWLDSGRRPFAGPDAIAEHRRRFRITMEDRARSEVREWSITDWFSALEDAFDLSDVADLARHAELVAEHRATRPAPGVQDLLTRLSSSTSRLIAVSDTWLTESMLAELLGAHGIEVDHVFTSASRGASKRNGEIFQIVERELDVPGAHVVHVGDNLKSDYIRPVGRRWRSIWLPDVDHVPDPGPYLALSTRSTSWHDVWRAASTPVHSDAGRDELYRCGRDLIAPTLLINAVWQARTMRARHVESALFIAREGRVLADVFDALRPVLADVPNPTYARLSRRSVLFASARNPLLTGQGLPGKTQPNAVGEHLASIGTPPKLKAELLGAASLTAAAPWTADTKHALNEAASRLADQIAAARRRCAADLESYLYEIIGESASDRIAVVDSGWAGTIQDVLSEILPAQTTLTGVYLGVSADGRAPTKRSSKRGIIRDDYRSEHPGHPGFEMAGVIRVLELLLAELTEGSAVRLERDGSGRVGVELAQPPMERLPEWLDQLRCGVLAGVECRRVAAELLYHHDKIFTLDDLEAAACVGMRALLLTPPRALATRLLSMSSEEGAAPGRTNSLDIHGIWSGSAWLTGIAAKYGMGFSNPVLETTIAAYDALVRKSS